jgi:hypothetical protein
LIHWRFTVIGFGVIVIGALLLIVPALLAALVLWAVGRRRVDDGAAAGAALRHESWIAVASTLVAVATTAAALSVPVTWSAALLRGDDVPDAVMAVGPFAVALAPFAVALAYCAVRAAGELTWPRPRGAVRSAPLTRRTLRDLGGPRLRWLLASAALLIVTLVVAGLTATPDGASVPHPVRTMPDGSVLTGASGPYPGWAYGVPLLVGLALTLLATAGTLRIVARRTPLSEVPRAHDDAVRCTSAARILAGVQLCVGATTAFVLLVMGASLANAGASVSTDGESFHTPGLVALAVGLAVVGVVVGIASIVGAVTAAVRPRPEGAA